LGRFRSYAAVVAAWTADDPSARPTDGNRIHPTAVVGAGVELGTGNIIGAYAVLVGPLTLGNDNWIAAHAVVGTPGESRGAVHPVADAPCGNGCVIGNGNVLREFSSVHNGLHEITRIGNDCFVMAGAHVGHDVQLGNEVTIANAVMLGGHTWIGRRANVGLGAVVHQRSVIGAGAMVAMGAGVKAPIPPYATAAGSPARVGGVNRRQALLPDAGNGDEATLARLTDYYRSRELPADSPDWLASDVSEYEQQLAAEH
jgi:UDP-N-acetylglucosamine acyltransferase